MALKSVRGMSILVLLLACVALAGARPIPVHPAAVTIVSIPWGTATLNGGQPFVVPATLPLEPGEYTLRVSRDGFAPVERTIVIQGEAPQHHLVRLVAR